MKVLITGGCGFLGSNIASAYLKEGAEVIVVDALFRAGGESNLTWLQGLAEKQQLSFYRHDIAERNGLEAIFKKHSRIDYICHLGGQVAMTTSLSDPERDMRTNVIGTFNVLECMREFCPDALLAYSSTNKVYGDLEYLDYQETETRNTIPDFPNGLDESTPLDFASPYGCSKGSADQYVHDWYRNYGLKTVVFRHSSIYGGRQFSTIDQGWIGWFCQKALEQKEAEDIGAPIPEFTISGSGKQVRDVLHAEDLIALYQSAYARKEVVAGDVFNIGGGLSNSLSLLELFEMLETKLGLKAHLNFNRLPRRQSDQDFFVANITKANDVIGWSPIVSSDDGVTRMLNWTRASAL